jgi:UDP-N-acetylglucosamine:LPS N-acetylglucosamine transferase
MEVDLVKRAGLPFQAIAAAGVHGVGIRALPGNLLQLARGYQQARHILQDFQPDVLFFTGGYIAVPMALAGRKIPSVLYVPDIEPGLALKTLGRFADAIAITGEEARTFYPGHARVTVTGYPVRSDLNVWGLAEAQQALRLHPELPTLLVFGGSKGARSINRALLSILPSLLNEMQVVHISGRLDWSEIEAARASLIDRVNPTSLADRYHAFPYLHEEMGAALTTADLVVSRAGASTLGEFPLFGLPAILVPYPHAWHYQLVNAQYLEKHGAARIIMDADLPGKLLPVVQEVMGDRILREKMRYSMKSLARPTAAESIYAMIQSLAIKQDLKRL